MGVLWLNSDRPDVLLRQRWILTDQLAFIPGLTVLIGFHDRLLFVLSKGADFFLHSEGLLCGQKAAACYRGTAVVRMTAFRNHRRRQLAESDGWARFQITDIGRIKGALTNDRIAASCSQGTTGQNRSSEHFSHSRHSVQIIIAYADR